MTSDEPWTSGWRLCVWCAPGLAASVTTAAEDWHWSCCCSASQHGPACFGSVAVCQVTSTARHTTVSYSSRDATRRCCTQSFGELCGQHVPYVPQGTRVKRANYDLYTSNLLHQLLLIVQRYVVIKLEVSMAFVFQEDQRHGPRMDGRTGRTDGCNT